MSSLSFPDNITPTSGKKKEIERTEFNCVKHMSEVVSPLSPENCNWTMIREPVMTLYKRPEAQHGLVVSWLNLKLNLVLSWGNLNAAPLICNAAHRWGVLSHTSSSLSLHSIYICISNLTRCFKVCKKHGQRSKRYTVQIVARLSLDRVS